MSGIFAYIDKSGLIDMPKKRIHLFYNEYFRYAIFGHDSFIALYIQIYIDICTYTGTCTPCTPG